MYALQSVVMDGRRRADVAVTPFGIRAIAYDSDRGFLLNGRRVKMRGVNLHGVVFDDVTIDEVTEFMKALTDPAARDLTRIVPARVPSGLPVDGP